MYFKHYLTKVPYRVIVLNEESRENGYFFGINTFINKKYQLNGPFLLVINHRYGFKRWVDHKFYGHFLV